MRAAEVAFVGALVHRFRVLGPVLQEHLDDYDGLLPHVFLGEVTRWVLADQESTSEVDLAALLDFIEVCFGGGSEHERELIAVSFLENLPHPGEDRSGILSQLGPGLRDELGRIR